MIVTEKGEKIKRKTNMVQTISKGWQNLMDVRNVK